MIDNSAFREALGTMQVASAPIGTVDKQDLLNQKSRIIDPLAYSIEFEQALLPQITLLQSTLDYVALQLQSTHQRRILTRLEHNIFATASLAFEQAESFGLNCQQQSLVASDFLMKGMRSALQMVIPVEGRGNTLDIILRRLNANCSDLKGTCEIASKLFLTWDNPQNLSELLDLNSSTEIKLQSGNLARKLHYLCQLSIFTSTPKRPDDYPLSVIVTPEEYFSLATMWARKPSLYIRNALITESGKLIISKLHDDSEIFFRKNLGIVADLYIQLAKLIQKSAATHNPAIYKRRAS